MFLKQILSVHVNQQHRPTQNSDDRKTDILLTMTFLLENNAIHVGFDLTVSRKFDA